jgi:hypothetical protein
MSVFIVVTLIVLVFIIIYQISKASEYTAVIRGEEKVKAQTNRTIAALLVVTFVVSMWGIWECNEIFKDRMLPIAACKTGENYYFILFCPQQQAGNYLDYYSCDSNGYTCCDRIEKLV